MSRKCLALGALPANARSAAMGPLMIPEIEAVRRDDARGLIREIYQRADRPGVVMVCDAEDRAEVEAMLAALLLAKAGFLDARVVDRTPFGLWTTLCARPTDQCALPP